MNYSKLITFEASNAADIKEYFVNSFFRQKWDKSLESVQCVSEDVYMLRYLPLQSKLDPLVQKVQFSGINCKNGTVYIFQEELVIPKRNLVFFQIRKQISLSAQYEQKRVFQLSNPSKLQPRNQEDSIEEQKDILMTTERDNTINQGTIFQEYLTQALDKLREFENQISLDQWKISVEDKKKGLNIWQRTSENGLKCMKAQGIIEKKADDIVKVIGDDDYRKYFDPVFDFSTVLERVADQTYMVYQKTKRVAIVSARDFMFILHLNKMPNGTIYAIVFSIDADHIRPQQKGIVRGWLQLGGWKLEPLADDPNKTFATYQTEIDMRGSVPQFVMTQANKDIGYQIVKIRKVVDIYLKDKQQ
ncbi:star-related lipid transfer protein 4 [Stylonychia lemnae]|uniref:Star-related lipid transfer protein 4 n=1 Tax=Stylonychia lemnae TaxID=5949 RepID=A0A078AMZ1_STYLE|nr:star-related lipid transfer protein 4 [Stylonychia lemnae]|eukprot:CDW82258.1 star-related lipid transfer protein 4 [Stylonychia lemnae]